MMRRGLMFGVVAFAAALFGILTSQAAVARTVLVLNSQKGDYIGGGTRHTYNTGDGKFSVSLRGDAISVSFSGKGGRSSLDIEAPEGETLAIGLYEDAQRHPFQSPRKPGLEFSSGGKGCDRLSGRFLISDIAIDANRTVTRLAVDFEQHCELRQPALYGSFRYNSSISIEPRVSLSDAKALKGNAGTSNARIVASLSMPSASTVEVPYRTVDDTALDGTDYRATSGTVVFAPGVTEMPIVVPVIGDRTARGNTAFAVTVDGLGVPIGEGMAQVEILDPNIPMTILTLNGQRGDGIATFKGNGKAWRITPNDTTFTTSRNSENGVSVRLGSPDYWSVDMVGPHRQVLRAKEYKKAQRYPFEPAGVPGLSVDGRGFGCNTLKGNFLVNAAQYAGNGSMQSFSADFEQRCDGLRGTLFGSVSVNAVLHQASVTNAVIAGRTAVFTVTLNPASTKSETVQFSTRDDTALAGVDYDSVSESITFAAGETEKTVRVRLLGGAHSEKQFFGLLSSTRTPVWVHMGSVTIE